MIGRIIYSNIILVWYEFHNESDSLIDMKLNLKAANKL